MPAQSAASSIVMEVGNSVLENASIPPSPEDVLAIGGPAGVAGGPAPLGIVNSWAADLEMATGLSPNFAQVLTWLLIFTLGWILIQMLQGIAKGLFQKRRKLGNSVLIIGECGAGKTALFFRLRDQVEVQSVSSLKPLRDKLQIENLGLTGPIDVVDCPGHQRMRGKSSELIKEARCLLFVVDSEDKQKLKDVAEHLYELLTHPDLLELRTPILLALNKVDVPSARTEKFIVDEIDREIEIMRNSRAATLEGQDQADSYLGIDGVKFKILEHAPCPISTCRISVKRSELDPLYEFLREQFA